MACTALRVGLLYRIIESSSLYCFMGLWSAEPHCFIQSDLAARPSSHPCSFCIHRWGLTLEGVQLDSHRLPLRGRLALGPEAIWDKPQPDCADIEAITPWIWQIATISQCPPSTTSCLRRKGAIQDDHAAPVREHTTRRAGGENANMVQPLGAGKAKNAMTGASA